MNLMSNENIIDKFDLKREILFLLGVCITFGYDFEHLQKDFPNLLKTLEVKTIDEFKNLCLEYFEILGIKIDENDIT